MKNKIAKIFKVIAIVIFILGFISGMFYGIMEENLFMFFTVCIASFIQGIVFYAIAEIIEQLDYANTVNRGIYNVLERIDKQIEKNTFQKATVSKEIIKNAANDTAEPYTWNCPQCGNMSLSTSLFCKVCGHPKSDINS